jgi:hypothetical protein
MHANYCDPKFALLRQVHCVWYHVPTTYPQLEPPFLQQYRLSAVIYFIS